MGCCASCARHVFSEDFQLVPLTKFQLSGVSQNDGLQTLLIQAYNAQKQAKLFDRQEDIQMHWETYIRNMTYTINIMQTALYSQSFAHFNIVPQCRRLGFHDETLQQHFSNHLRLVHVLVDNCLRGLREYDMLDQAVTLFCLGRYHFEKGVETDELKAFASSAADVIKKVNSLQGEVMHPSDTKFFNSFFKFMSGCIILGMTKQAYAVNYMNMLVEKRGNCMTRRRAEQKFVTARAKTSWKRIANQILSK